jgi:hypothetical protein
MKLDRNRRSTRSRTSKPSTSRAESLEIENPRGSSCSQSRSSSTISQQSTYRSSRGSSRGRGSGQTYRQERSPLIKGPTKQDLDRVHEEHCPDFATGCVFGSTCQRMHDYTKTTLEQQARMIDIVIGETFELNQDLNWINCALINLLNKIGLQKKYKKRFL